MAAADSIIRGHQAGWVIFASVLLVLLAGVVVVVGRSILGTRNDSTSLIRSWIAISLVGGLILFGAISFDIADANLRNTLFGGLVANTGAAVAFYFASKSADQARQDILGASFGTDKVPDLKGKSVSVAQTMMAASPLILDVTPAGGTGTITVQDPLAGTTVRKGTVVSVTADQA